MCMYGYIYIYVDARAIDQKMIINFEEIREVCGKFWHQENEGKIKEMIKFK